jgi:hypothetical protein
MGDVLGHEYETLASSTFFLIAPLEVKIFEKFTYRNVEFGGRTETTAY